MVAVDPFADPRRQLALGRQAIGKDWHPVFGPALLLHRKQARLAVGQYTELVPLWRAYASPHGRDTNNFLHAGPNTNRL
jgi:hypothetical protein